MRAAKPLDPSLPQGFAAWCRRRRQGLEIDATIDPEAHSASEHYERITYAYADRAKIDDYVNGKADDAGEAGDPRAVEALAATILAAIGEQPLYYTDVAERFAAYDFRTIARALGHLHATERLWQDPRGAHACARLDVRGEAAGEMISPVSLDPRCMVRSTRAAPSSRAMGQGTQSGCATCASGHPLSPTLVVAARQASSSRG